MRIITIARPFGAGGQTLGERVSNRLGFRLVHEEMVNAVAEKAQVSPDWVRSVEAERGNRVLNFFGNLVSPTFVERLMDDEKKGYINEDIYVEALQDVMWEITRETDAVIIGRGGQYLLHEHPQAVHVLLIADTEYRVGFVKKKFDLTEDRARQIVSRGDRRRNNFYKKIGHKDFDDASLYTVVLNMAHVTLQQAEDVIVRLAQDL